MLRDIDASEASRVLVMAASTRTGSINQALARAVTDEIGRSEPSVSLVDLAEYPMPLYQADIEATEGVPASVHELAERVAAAEVLVIVTPEYNGAFPPLLKNTVDWLTRVDTAVLARLRVLLASASPGRGGGANAVAMVRIWMDNVGVTVAESSLSIGSAELGPDGRLANLDTTAVAAFARQATLAPEGRTRP